MPGRNPLLSQVLFDRSTSTWASYETTFSRNPLLSQVLFDE